MIDNQIAQIMPNAKPTPNSSNSTSYAFWEMYLDYVILSQKITSTSSKGKPRPSYPVTVPVNQSSYHIDGMSNPYPDAFPDATSTEAQSYRNKIGYRTFVQFMMDFGREAQPVSGQYVPLSRFSSYCPWHNEATDGGTFSFPPREQPTHSARRAIIAALQIIKERNATVSDPTQRDWVSIITFDTVSGVQVAMRLTYDYDAAMQTCTTFQAVSDINSSTATETGLITAKTHIASSGIGSHGRTYADKVVVLLTDGIPNLYSSSTSQINNYISQHSSSDFYSGGEYAKNAALMQSTQMQLQKWMVFPVGIGLGCNYDFMDRAARMGGTANSDGRGPRGSGNPAEYEQRLKDIFDAIISNPKARLVK